MFIEDSQIVHFTSSEKLFESSSDDPVTDEPDTHVMYLRAARFNACEGKYYLTQPP